MSKPILQLLALVALALALSDAAAADMPQTSNGITTIHLDQYNGFFSAQETLAGLKPGIYDVVVTNKAGKTAGFQIQSGQTHAQLDMFPLDPGSTRTSRVKITGEGFRYRCPINPTPWYEVGVSG